MRVPIFLILAVFLLPVSAGSSRVEQLTFEGIERLYRVHNIEAAERGAAPMVLHLHGYRSREKADAGRDTLDYIAWDRLEETAETHEFVLVQPAAYWGQWNLFPGVKNIRLENGVEFDDVKFIFGVVDSLVRAGIVDKSRVYLSGISDGAIMSYRLLCDSDSPFAAAVAIVGSMYEKHMLNCNAKTPAPIMVIAGTNDRILPYDGWLFPTGREASIPETMEHWRLMHGCKGQKTELLNDRELDDNSSVRSVVWTECEENAAVKLLRVQGGGHAVPSYKPVSDKWREKSGGHNRDIESAEEVWAFANRFRR